MQTECNATAAASKNVTVTSRNKPSYNLSHKEDSTLVQELGAFENMVAVTQKEQIQSRFKNPGKRTSSLDVQRAIHLILTVL